MATHTNNPHSFPDVIGSKLDELNGKVGEIHTLLTGGHDPSKGIIVRLDRVEQSYGMVKKFFWVVVGVLVTPASIGGVLWYLVSQHVAK